MSRCLLVLVFALAVCAQEAPPQYHFLFIIDSSISMAERKQASITAVRDVIRSGFAAQIEPGDLLDIWSRDNAPEEERFPALEWNPRRGGTILTIVGDYLTATKFHRGNHIAPVLRELASFVPTTKGLIVVLLTDGEEQVSGFEFDAELNHEIARLRHDADRARRPILVALSAVDGQFVEWHAKIGTDLSAFPRLPVRVKPTPPPPPVAQAAPEIVLPQPQPEPERPSILNLPPGAKILPATVQGPEPLAPKLEPRAEVVEAHTQPVVAASVVPPAAQVIAPNPVETTPPPPKPMVVITPPVTAKTEISLVQLAVKTNSATESVRPSPAPKMLEAPVLSESSHLRPVYLLGGLGGLSVLAALVLATRPRGGNRINASLISRSLAK